MSALEFRTNVLDQYADIYTPAARAAMAALVHLNTRRLDLMAARLDRRARRHDGGQHISFLDPGEVIEGTTLSVAQARAGEFVGSPIPRDLQRQWIQGTGPGAKPNTSIGRSIRNVAYALLSGADGWMFDGEDALGQTSSMSLDNQRNLGLAIARDAVFLDAATTVAGEMNAWSTDFLGRAIIADWEQQLGFTVVIFRTRGLHLDDRHVREADATGLGASLVDVALFVTNNHERLQTDGRSIVLYLPKIQTAAEAALWNDLLATLEEHLGLAVGTIKTYVLVEQLEAAFQLMEIRAALGPHFIGFNTGRWDYINSVSDAMAGDGDFINPNIDAITMTYGYMRHYEDRVRRAVNTADNSDNFALWQGGMEPNIPVGSANGIAASMAKALAGAQREQHAGASGKWVAHWKMVHIVRPVWEQAGEANQLGRTFPPLTYTAADTAALIELEPAPRTLDGARDLLSVAIQYGNAFGQGLQAAALKPADHFGNDDVLYLMEDMATGEIRLSILWEWLHKHAKLDDGQHFNLELFQRLLDQEYEKLQAASGRDVHANSKQSTLPIAHDIAAGYVTAKRKPPWYIDLLNINLDNMSRAVAGDRIQLYQQTLAAEGRRVTENLDFVE